MNIPVTVTEYYHKVENNLRKRDGIKYMFDGTLIYIQSDIDGDVLYIIIRDKDKKLVPVYHSDMVDVIASHL